jgi:hypothetical protein
MAIEISVNGCCVTALAVIDEENMPANDRSGLDPGQRKQKARETRMAVPVAIAFDLWLSFAHAFKGLLRSAQRD